VNPWLRPGLLLLGAQAAVVGGWAVLSPRSFYGEFPVFGGSWVNALPPYNEHLIRDVGGLYIGFALLFFVAAFTLEPILVKAALIAWLPFAALHFFFHATHLEGLTFSEKVLQLVSLGIVVLLPLALLWGQRRRGSTFF
jgi:hypothetical protein